MDPLGKSKKKKFHSGQFFVDSFPDYVGILLFFLFGSNRHVIVGRNFGSYVTHETKHFIYFYLGQVAILLFKSG
jgi:hypothetical protein